MLICSVKIEINSFVLEVIYTLVYDGVLPVSSCIYFVNESALFNRLHSSLSHEMTITVCVHFAEPPFCIVVNLDNCIQAIMFSDIDANANRRHLLQNSIYLIKKHTQPPLMRLF